MKIKLLSRLVISAVSTNFPREVLLDHILDSGENSDVIDAGRG